MTIHTKRLVIRELIITDLENIHELHSLPETDEFNTLGLPETIEVTRNIMRGWLGSMKERPRKKYVFCIESEGSEFIGLLGLSLGKPGYGSAEIWYKLHSTHWNQGFATEAVNGILRFGFVDLQLHRIEAGCATGNLASKRVLEKVGMTQEGICRKVLPIRGQWLDNYEFAILNTDFADAAAES